MRRSTLDVNDVRVGRQLKENATGSVDDGLQTHHFELCERSGVPNILNLSDNTR